MPAPVRQLGSRPGSLGSFIGATLNRPIITLELPKDAGQDQDQLWKTYGEALSVRRSDTKRSHLPPGFEHQFWLTLQANSKSFCTTDGGCAHHTVPRPSQGVLRPERFSSSSRDSPCVCRALSAAAADASSCATKSSQWS